MAAETTDPSAEIDARFAQMQADGDWRADTMGLMRRLIKEADPDVVETIKWRKPSNPDGVPAYLHDGLIGTLEPYKDKVKFTFATGGRLDDPAGVFTGGFGGVRRVVDLFEGDTLDQDGFKDLVRQAVAWNAGQR